MASSAYAALDIGSNTVKTLVVMPAGSGLRQVEDACEVTWLGGGMAAGMLSHEAMERTKAAICRQVGFVRGKFPDAAFAGVATSAVRDAVNGRAFLDECGKAAGLDGKLRIVSGEEEAVLTFTGASCRYADGCPFVNADPGGGSTEFSIGFAGSRPLYLKSLQVGCVRWCERCNMEGVVGKARLECAICDASEAMKPVAEAAQRMEGFAQCPLSISGGTSHMAASLAAGRLYCPGEAMPELCMDGLYSILDVCASVPVAERAFLPGMPEGRAPIATAGIVILCAILRALGRESFLPNEGGLRCGIIKSVLMHWM